jgi:hypothetical protein
LHQYSQTEKSEHRKQGNASRVVTLQKAFLEEHYDCYLPCSARKRSRKSDIRKKLVLAQQGFALWLDRSLLTEKI